MNASKARAQLRSQWPTMLRNRKIAVTDKGLKIFSDRCFERSNNTPKHWTHRAKNIPVGFVSFVNMSQVEPCTIEKGFSDKSCELRAINARRRGVSHCWDDVKTHGWVFESISCGAKDGRII